MCPGWTVAVGATAIELAPAALMSARACAANPVCWNQLGIAVAEFAAGDALGGGTLSMTVSTGGRLTLQKGNEIVGLIDDTLGQLAKVSREDAQIFSAANGSLFRLDGLGRLISTDGAAFKQSVTGRVFILGGAPKGETVTLYRGVSLEEYNSIATKNGFSMVPGTMETKQFGLSLEETLKYANSDKNIVAIVAATVPKEIVNAEWYSKTIDPFIFKSGVITVPGNELYRVNDSMINLIQPRY